MQAIINEAPDVCISILANGHLKRPIVRLGGSRCIWRQPEKQRAGIGENIADLHFAPADLFKLVSPYAHPLDFIRDSREQFEKLEHGYQHDMRSAAAITPERATSSTTVFILPNQAWGAPCQRRVYQ